MGTCYSKKASGGNNPYMTSQMAATKLDEASRLARPTPYTRSGNANIEFAAKKNVPLPTKFNTLSTVEQGDIKNLKHYQSSIPRFSSSLPTATGEQRIGSPLNENETLHVVNNNAIVNSRSAFNVSSTSPSSSNKYLNKSESLIKPKKTSKSCPEKILSPDNERIVRTPARGSGISPRQNRNKSPGPQQAEIKVFSKSQQSKTVSGRNSGGPSPVSKSPSRKGFESRDSLSDFDSGIGNSLTDKNRPEDSDTVKDLEQLELQDESSPNLSLGSKSSAGTPKSPSDSKLAVKAPTYKREPNGKWSFDDKHFGPESTLRTSEPKSIPNSGPSSPREKHPFKMTASENIFSTYASYKGLLSYQKKSFRSPENGKLSPKTSRSEKTSRVVQSSVSNLSSIPKIRRHGSQPTPGGSIFYCTTEENQCSETKYDNAFESTVKSNNDTKQSSLDSDEKSDSTGVLSPPSEENREFLIDDEIADQPGLTFGNEPKSEDSDVQSLQMAMSELHALQMSSSVKKRTDSVSSYSSRKGRFGDHRDSLILGSELGSSCSSIASDDLMLDYEKSYDGFPEGTVNEGPASPMRKLHETETDKVTPLKKEKKFDFEEKARKRISNHRKLSGPLSTSADRLEWRQRTVSLPLRPPRQMSVCEADDGGLKLDSSSYRLLCQDLNGVKTLLLRLKSVIQEAETINPFDQSSPNNIFYHSLVQNDLPSSLASSTSTEKKTPDLSTIYQENADMKRQLVLLQQQLEDKDHTINLLQQQMTKYLNIQVNNCNHGLPTCNAATQTDRSRSLTASLSSSSSADDSIETLVSAQEDFEKSFKRNSKDQDVLTEHLIEVVRLLDRNSAIYPSQSEC
ncbi:serine-rich adhesin for platelets isoform X1 [Parasteatoda tepidariorum]|nr:uncharacterized protein LOC107455430 isoform X1 [Parasteatoda tepidariorum]